MHTTATYKAFSLIRIVRTRPKSRPMCKDAARTGSNFKDAVHTGPASLASPDCLLRDNNSLLSSLESTPPNKHSPVTCASLALVNTTPSSLSFDIVGVLVILGYVLVCLGEIGYVRVQIILCCGLFLYALQPATNSSCIGAFLVDYLALVIFFVIIKFIYDIKYWYIEGRSQGKRMNVLASWPVVKPCVLLYAHPVPRESFRGDSLITILA